MTLGPITSWQTQREKVGAVSDFLFLSSKNCRWFLQVMKLKDPWILGRKAMTNLDGLLKSKGITLTTKAQRIKAMAFSVVMYTPESWTIKKTEC